MAKIESNQNSSKELSDIERKTKGVIASIQGDLIATTNFIALQFTTLNDKKKGVLSDTDQDFLDMRNSLLNAPKQQGKDSKSVKVLVEEINEKIENLIKEGAKSEAFEEIRSQVNQFQIDIEKKLSSTQNVNALIEDSLRKTAIRDVLPFFNLPTDKQRDLVNLISSKLTELPASLYKSYKPLTSNMREFLSPIIKSNAKELLGEEKDGLVVLSNEKLNNNLSTFVAKISNEAVVLDVCINSIDRLKEKTGLNITEERYKKIMEHLTPALAKLDPEYLTKNSDIIAEQLAKELKSERGFRSYFSKDYTVSSANLDKIAAKISKEHMVKSREFEREKFVNIISKTNKQKILIDISKEPLINNIVSDLGNKLERLPDQHRSQIITEIKKSLNSLDDKYLESNQEALTKTLEKVVSVKGHRSLIDMGILPGGPEANQRRFDEIWNDVASMVPTAIKDQLVQEIVTGSKKLADLDLGPAANSRIEEIKKTVTQSLDTLSPEYLSSNKEALIETIHNNINGNWEGVHHNHEQILSGEFINSKIQKFKAEIEEVHVKTDRLFNPEHYSNKPLITQGQEELRRAVETIEHNRKPELNNTAGTRKRANATTSRTPPARGH